MISINAIMLIVGLFLLMGIVSSKFSARIGMPVLLLFLGIGMLAGSEGIGRIAFENYSLANSVGSVALAMILFDGGLRTTLSSVRAGWRPALSLATVGVLLTAALTGIVAAWILEIPLLHGMLLGSIVGSTDAAAVFSILRTSGIKLPESLTAALEVESGSNDPMAIFLTVGLISLITGDGASAKEIGLLFVLQFGVGGLVGLGMGNSAVWAVNRISLSHSGLYPLLVMAFGLITFGVAAVLGGSGFLAVYIAGIVLGSSTIVFKRGIFLFHDAFAWLNQIVLFIMLGLLSFPSRLISVAYEGFLIAAVLILVARPLAVLVSAVWFRFRLNELTFLSWVGLKGAVPITLATFPLMAGIPDSETLFSAIFFVVIVSAITQGWTLSIVARWLRLSQPTNPPPLTIEISSLQHVDGDIVDYTVLSSARVAGQMLRNLALPTGIIVTLIVRDGNVIMPRGTTVVQPGDHIYIAMRTQLRPFVDNLFETSEKPAQLTPDVRLTFHADSRAEQIHWFFNLPAPQWPKTPLRDMLEPSDRNSTAELGPFQLTWADDDDFVVVTIVTSSSPMLLSE